MFEKLYSAFWYIVGWIDGLLYVIKCLFQFMKWSKTWSKEHSTATEEMYENYAKNWWLERFPDVFA